MPYNKLLTNLANSSRTGEYWPSVVSVRTSLRSVRTATTSGQYSPVRPSRSVSKRLIFIEKTIFAYSAVISISQATVIFYEYLITFLASDNNIKNYNTCTVEPPMSKHIKCHAWVVTYRGWLLMRASTILGQNFASLAYGNG